MRGICRCWGFCLAVGALCLSGCWTSSEREVVVYCALDREFSEPILQEFERQSGIRVLAKYDVESTKTVGLANAILAEQNRPRCDLFWNNEILHTLRLERAGLLAPYAAPAARDWPAEYRSPQHAWHGLAARARVLLVNTELLPEADRPQSIRDLASERWKGRCGLAKPLFGTTATHAAVLFAEWGPERAEEYFRQVRASALVLSGNKQVAEAVSAGQIAFGLTDTDDALVELDKGRPVAIVFPDQEAGGIGALRIPNSLAVIQGSPHGENARRLVDFLLGPAVETRLAEGASGQIPVNPEVRAVSRALPMREVRWMAVDFAAAAEAWEAASGRMRDLFAAADGAAAK